MNLQILIPEFFVDFSGRIHTGGIAVKDGHILGVGDKVLHMAGEKLKLDNQVILPGFVNSHSHAFQRLLRGLVERKPNVTLKNNFFTWREKMYSLAQGVSKDTLEIIARFVFQEMLEVGFTHVAEFHYLHHEPHESDTLALSRALVRAASQQQINLTLFECAYQRNNFDDPLKPEQRRFAFNTVHDFLAFVEDARLNLPNDYCSVGIAIHSVRAVDEEWFLPIHDRAEAHALPLHVHVSEQRADVDVCLAARGVSPIALLNRNQLLSPRTTLVHATHLIRDDVEILANSLATICMCPSTEKNLGDGFAEILSLKKRGIALCIGTDQHVRLDPFGEILSLEEQERLRTGQRLVLNQEGEYLFEALLPCLTTNGLRSLNIHHAQDSFLGAPANLVGLTLPPEYLWHGPKAALDAMIVASQPSSIATVMSKGQLVVTHGQPLSRDKKYLTQEIGKFFRSINFT